MEKTKISIVVPVYNKSQWLARCLDSILCQTYKNIEVITVDNGSTDGSLDILKEYQKKDNRISLIDLFPGKGLPNGHNVGLDNITGEYFTVVDADDYIDKDYIEKLLAAIKDSGADIAMCVNDIDFEAGASRHKPRPDFEQVVIDETKIDKLPCQLLDELNTEYFGFPMPEIGAEWIKLVKTSIIQENNIRYNSNLHIWVDWVFYMEILKHVRKMVFITTTKYHFFQTDISETRVGGYKLPFINKSIDAIDAMRLTIDSILTPELQKAFNKFCTMIMISITWHIIKNIEDVPVIDIENTSKKFHNNKSIAAILTDPTSSAKNKTELEILQLWNSDNPLLGLKKMARRRKIRASIKRVLPDFIIRIMKRIYNMR